MSLYGLAYSSRSCLEGPAPLIRSAVEDIVQKARVRNSGSGVASALMFIPPRFTQVLEGEELKVRRIFRSIQRDTRHADVVVIVAGTVPLGLLASPMTYAGASPAAEEYYRDYFLGRTTWTKSAYPAICELMRKLIQLDGAFG